MRLAKDIERFCDVMSRARGGASPVRATRVGAGGGTPCCY